MTATNMFFDLNNEEKVIITKLNMILNSAIFLDSNFRLFNLANLVGFPPVVLSKLIKKVYGFSFPDLILSYRLNYLDDVIKIELNQQKKVKINKLISKAGFNSRSNFYYSFNKMRNSNPKEYYCL
jgi:YesN/AraC family two-component response regulator